MFYEQQEFNIRLEWGLNGIKKLSTFSDVIIIVDILSFSTCVEIATNNKAIVFPYFFKDEKAKEYAEIKQALLADTKRNANNYSLSPSSLVDIPENTKIVLPSPNGATLSLNTGNIPTICGSLRNAQAVANYAQNMGKNILVIPAGEKWEDGTLRPSFEDLLGAGAIINYLNGSLSPESSNAKILFENLKDTILSYLKKCSSGKELIEKGFYNDVELASQLDISTCVPILKRDYYFKV